MWKYLDKVFTRKVQPYIKSGETSFSMEEEVKYLVPPSNGYSYGTRVGEMEENAKKPNMATIKRLRFRF